MLTQAQQRIVAQMVRSFDLRSPRLCEVKAGRAVVNLSRELRETFEFVCEEEIVRGMLAAGGRGVGGARVADQLNDIRRIRMGCVAGRSGTDTMGFTSRVLVDGFPVDVVLFWPTMFASTVELAKHVFLHEFTHIIEACGHELPFKRALLYADMKLGLLTAAQYEMLVERLATYEPEDDYAFERFYTGSQFTRTALASPEKPRSKSKTKPILERALKAVAGQARVALSEIELPSRMFVVLSFSVPTAGLDAGGDIGPRCAAWLDRFVGEELPAEYPRFDELVGEQVRAARALERSAGAVRFESGRSEVEFVYKLMLQPFAGNYLDVYRALFEDLFGVGAEGMDVRELVRKVEAVSTSPIALYVQDATGGLAMWVGVSGGRRVRHGAVDLRPHRAPPAASAETAAGAFDAEAPMLVYAQPVAPALGSKARSKFPAGLVYADDVLVETGSGIHALQGSIPTDEVELAADALPDVSRWSGEEIEGALLGLLGEGALSQVDVFDTNRLYTNALTLAKIDTEIEANLTTATFADRSPYLSGGELRGGIPALVWRGIYINPREYAVITDALSETHAGPLGTGYSASGGRRLFMPRRSPFDVAEAVVLVKKGIPFAFLLQRDGARGYETLLFDGATASLSQGALSNVGEGPRVDFGDTPPPRANLRDTSDIYEFDVGVSGLAADPNLLRSARHASAFGALSGLRRVNGLSLAACLRTSGSAEPGVYAVLDPSTEQYRFVYAPAGGRAGEVSAVFAWWLLDLAHAGRSSPLREGGPDGPVPLVRKNPEGFSLTFVKDDDEPWNTYVEWWSSDRSDRLGYARLILDKDDALDVLRDQIASVDRDIRAAEDLEDDFFYSDDYIEIDTELDRPVYLGQIEVLDEARRGRGLGTEMLRELEQALAQQGVSHVYLRAVPAERARWYTRMGYEFVYPQDEDASTYPILCKRLI